MRSERRLWDWDWAVSTDDEIAQKLEVKGQQVSGRQKDMLTLHSFLCVLCWHFLLKNHLCRQIAFQYICMFPLI